jgi:Mrp family chromosome partitioning ATPase
LQSPQLPVLLQKLDSWFDWIVIDSPPVLPMADTSVWARLADGILLVTRRGKTEKRKLQAGLESLDTTKLIGVLMNSSNDGANDYYRAASGATKTPEAET